MQLSCFLDFMPSLLCSHMSCMNTDIKPESGWASVNAFTYPSPTSRAAYMVTVPLAIIAVVTLALAGHSGATLVWENFP